MVGLRNSIMAEKSPSFQDCVERKIEILRKEDPKRPQNQNVAIAYQHCREKRNADSKDFDSVKITNQVIANEGVLSYAGKAMLKLWDDLKNFDGKIVPIIDEHPNSNNGCDGRVSGKERVYGTARIHSCVKGAPVLCADFDGSTDMPMKNGYSIGFVYNEEAKSGDHLGKHYDAIQHITEIDHIALTNLPRNPIALSNWPPAESLLPARDSAKSDVVIYGLAYDSFNAFKLQNDSDKTGSSVESKMPEDIEALKKEIADLKAEKAKASKDSTAIDSKALEDKIKSLESDKAKFEADAKQIRSLYEKEVAKQAKLAIDSLVGGFGVDAKSFDGKTKDFVDGAMFLANHIKSQPSSSSTSSQDSAGEDAVAMDSPNNYRWNASTGKMEKKGK